jgi:hypothetical protein
MRIIPQPKLSAEELLKEIAKMKELMDKKPLPNRVQEIQL